MGRHAAHEGAGGTAAHGGGGSTQHMAGAGDMAGHGGRAVAASTCWGWEHAAHGRSGSMAAHGREELEDRIFNHTHEKESKQEVR